MIKPGNIQELMSVLKSMSPSDKSRVFMSLSSSTVFSLAIKLDPDIISFISPNADYIDKNFKFPTNPEQAIPPLEDFFFFVTHPYGIASSEMEYIKNRTLETGDEKTYRTIMEVSTTQEFFRFKEVSPNVFKILSGMTVNFKRNDAIYINSVFIKDFSNPIDDYQVLINLEKDDDVTEIRYKQAMHVLSILKNKSIRCAEEKEKSMVRVKGKKQKFVKKITHVKLDRYEQKQSPLTGRFLEFTHSFSVMGHWRKARGYGKDRKGNYCIPGYTWVSEHIRGDGLFIKKQRMVLPSGQENIQRREVFN